MTEKQIKIGIVGVGKIVRDQHLPAITSNSAFKLLATASRNASVDGVTAFRTIEEMVEATPELDAVALCMPPQYRFQAAYFALQNGLHVLLEKPPGATVSEVEQLASLAQQRGVSLFATWHSRYGAAVEQAKDILRSEVIESVELIWKESVRKWHPNQEWVWQAGGLGVFDPGINGLSILTHVLPTSVFVSKCNLVFPQNKAAPIAAQMELACSTGYPINIGFDWRQVGDEDWSINFVTTHGSLKITAGGGELQHNDEVIECHEQNEYQTIYQRFGHMISLKHSDVDLTPLKLVADAFLLGNREIAEPFIDDANA